MKKQIRIGVFNCHPGLELMLNTMGIPWERCHNIYESWITNFSVIISETNNESFQKEFEYYLKAGGAVLDLSGAVQHYWLTRRNITTLQLDPDDAFLGDLNQIDIYHSVLKHPQADLAEKTIWIRPESSNPYIFCGLPFGKLFTDSSSAQKAFPVNEKKTAYEHVSRVSKQKLIHVLLRLLIRLHEIQNLPLVHKWWYPGDSDSLFAFRIDSDFASVDDAEKLIHFLNEESIPNSWFLHTKAHEKWLEHFRRLKNGEIAVHGYEHKVYDQLNKNILNIKKALHLLQSARFKPKGYASPYGIWNDIVQKSVKHFHFNYSSEFSYHYDGLPVFTRQSTLQLPIHPVCISSLIKAGADENEMILYFQSAAQLKFYFREPVIFYHHPLDNHQSVWKSVFDFIKNTSGVTSLTFLEWATWWRKRESSFLNAFVENGKLFLELSDNSDDFQISVHTGNNKFLITRPVHLLLKNAETKEFYRKSHKSQLRKINTGNNKAKLLKSEFFSRLWRL
ncbi:MAG: polysaccharide deacetylase family protein [Balneolaceae bacterium]